MGSDNYDLVVLLHPTSPVRDGKHIDEAVSALWTSTAPSLASVEYAKRSYRHNASIYAAKVPFSTLYNDHTIPFLMDRRHSVDIDDEIDFKIAELFLAKPESDWQPPVYMPGRLERSLPYGDPLPLG
jgi:CMP-N,N'-diacetyllegionaminic acid synthase